jgi:hypothetical protein
MKHVGVFRKSTTLDRNHYKMGKYIQLIAEIRPLVVKTRQEWGV